MENFFSNLWKSLTDFDLLKMIVYLFISLLVLVIKTKPSFGYERRLIPNMGINFFNMNTYPKLHNATWPGIVGKVQIPSRLFRWTTC
jgi:hypothetical protein